MKKHYPLPEPRDGVPARALSARSAGRAFFRQPSQRTDVHGNTELIMVCVKNMPEESVKKFIATTDGLELAQSLMNDPDPDHDHIHAHCEVTDGYDEREGSHYVKLRFLMEVEDIGNLEAWCLREGFQILESVFAPRPKS